MNVTLPTNAQQALRHFNTIESDETSLLEVFCFSSNCAEIGNIRKAYRRLAALVHPDRCKIDSRGANRAMMKLSRAMGIVESHILYQNVKFNIDESRTYVLPSSVLFSVSETEVEYEIRVCATNKKKPQQENGRSKSSDDESEQTAEEQRAQHRNTETENVRREQAEQDRYERLREERKKREEQQENERLERDRMEGEMLEGERVEQVESTRVDDLCYDGCRSDRPEDEEWWNGDSNEYENPSCSEKNSEEKYAEVNLDREKDSYFPSKYIICNENDVDLDEQGSTEQERSDRFSIDEPGVTVIYVIIHRVTMRILYALKVALEHHVGKEEVVQDVL